jgi:HSP20 family protein
MQIKIYREFTDRAGRQGARRLLCCPNSTTGPWEPNTDIFETADTVHIVIEVPGVERSNLDLKLKNSTLYINGFRKPTRPENEITYHQLELHYGNFEKQIPLPESLEHNEINASLVDGILEIKISKQSNAIEIPIKVAEPE